MTHNKMSVNNKTISFIYVYDAVGNVDSGVFISFSRITGNEPLQRSECVAATGGSICSERNLK